MRIPVATTTPRALPLTTLVPARSTFRLRLFEPVPMGASGGEVSAEEVRAGARRRLEGVISRDARVYSHVSEVVLSGKPYREILREATAQASDLIVMGAHGGVLGALGFGSTTNHVVREATCPVLTLRA
jgi:nucleotide-binding universal stress UspA family protein